MYILKILNLNKYYKISKNNNFKALNNINLEFEKGEIVSILGESGSGKSTLMNILGGLDNSYQGEVIVNGKDLKEHSEKELDKYRKNRVGFIFQSFNLISHLSVLDNVTIAMTLSNISKKKRLERAIEVLSDLGLKDQINKKPNQLSGGQKQRVAIARALVNNPDILLADEPTGALDSQTSGQILEILKNISSKGKLIIMVTHSELVASISSRIVTLVDGNITSNEIKKKNIHYKEEKFKINKEKQNLSFLSAIKLALNNMKQKLTRNLLVSIGASIGIMSVITMLSLGEGIKAYVTDTMNQTVNPLVIEVNKNIERDENYQPLEGQTTSFEEGDISTLSKINGVDKVELGFSKTVMGSKIMVGDNRYGLQLINTISDSMVSKSITLGKLSNSNEILISSSLYEAMKKKIDVLGTEVEIQLFENNKIVDKKVVISGVYDSGFQMNQIFINYNDIRDTYISNGVDFKPTTLYLIMKEESFVKDAKLKIESLGYAPSLTEQILKTFNEMLDVLTYVLSGIAAISLFVSAIMILVVLYISVVERTNEIGVLKAIGARRKDIKRIFVSEAFLIGLSSGIIGVLLAFFIKIIANYYTNKMFDVNVVKINPEFILLGIIVSIIISVLSGLWPASRAAKLDPIESLRHE